MPPGRVQAEPSRDDTREDLATAAPARALTLQQAIGNRAMARLAAGNARPLARRTQADTLKDMQATEGYKALTEDQRKRLDALVGGSTSLATHGWGKVDALLSDAKADKTKADTFSKFLSGKSWLNFDVRLPGEKRLSARKHTLAAPVEVKDHPYRSGKADARRHDVTVTDTWPDGTDATMTISIFEPKKFTPYKAGRILPKIQDMADVLAEIPLQSRARIKRVDLHPVKNPDDTYWEKNKEYNPSGKEFNSHMTAGSDGIVDIFPSTANADPTEIETSLVHETGHVASNSAWGDDNTAKAWDVWRKARAADGISVSKYGDSSDHEDAAESWLLFTSSIGTPREAEVRALIPNRVKVLETLLQHNAAPAPAGGGGGGIGAFFSGIGSAIASGAKAVGGAIATGAKAAGGAIATGAKAVGSAVATGAKAVGGAIASGAKAVGGAVASGAKAVGGAVKSVFSKLKFW